MVLLICFIQNQDLNVIPKKVRKNCLTFGDTLHNTGG